MQQHYHLLVFFNFCLALFPWSWSFILQPVTMRKRCDWKSLSLEKDRRSSTRIGQVPTSPLGIPICDYYEIKIPASQPGPPKQAICVEDLTPILKERLEQSGLMFGVVTVISRHTTTAITINERESRLAMDMEQFFLTLVPPDERSVAATTGSGDTTTLPKRRYFHNDIHLRPDGDEEAQRCRDNGWDIDQPYILQKWRDQEPINAHSHLMVMLLGSSESIPVQNGRLVIGQWQSVLLVDCDAPRERTVGIQFMGFK